MTRVRYCSMLFHQVLSVIFSKFPCVKRLTKPIYIQQDGLKAHIGNDDCLLCFHVALYMSECEKNYKHSMDVKMTTQTPNSPDLNILDVVLFCALQSTDDEDMIDDTQLIEAVEKTCAEYDYKTINRVFLTQMFCFNAIIACEGDNVYKLPHINKNQLK